MGYYIDEHSVDLDWLVERLNNTDLIPSHESVLDGIAIKKSALAKAGIKSVGQLRSALKTEKSMTSLSKSSGIGVSYLQLLRRVINGFFPKPISLKKFDWLDSDTVASLHRHGIRNTRSLFDIVSKGAVSVARKTGTDKNELLKIMAMSDLCRIQWVSLTFARTLMAAGFTTAAAVAIADPEALFNAITNANKDARFYKGKVGLRDIKRLVAAAAYVP